MGASATVSAGGVILEIVNNTIEKSINIPDGKVDTVRGFVKKNYEQISEAARQGSEKLTKCIFDNISHELIDLAQALAEILNSLLEGEHKNFRECLYTDANADVVVVTDGGRLNADGKPLEHPPRLGWQCVGNAHVRDGG